MIAGRPMWRKLVIVAVILAAAIGAFLYLTAPARFNAALLRPRTPDLANGKTMFLIGGCASCHAVPGQEDRTRLGGGRALESPFGTFFAPNISPDRQNGIGRWSELDFVTAMTEGTSPEGEHYYPAFPYTSYRSMRLADVRDLFAYLKTLPPVQGKVREHRVAFPYNIRHALGGWKLLFHRREEFKPDPKQSAQWNRGAYLVNGPGHCAECHSPRDALGAVIPEQRFAGGLAPEGEGWVPNITQKGLADWSEKDIAYLLQSGVTPDGDSVGGSMTEVVRNTSQLAAEDRAAMAVYLKSLLPVDGPPKPPKPQQPS
jgi:mono/diheme cytochrome c family protein